MLGLPSSKCLSSMQHRSCLIHEPTCPASKCRRPCEPTFPKNASQYLVAVHPSAQSSTWVQCKTLDFQKKQVPRSNPIAIKNNPCQPQATPKTHFRVKTPQRPAPQLPAAEKPGVTLPPTNIAPVGRVPGSARRVAFLLPHQRTHPDRRLLLRFC